MNKKKLLAPLFIAASFLLVGCSADTIVGRPAWINQNIINGDFKDNKMKDIYDAIKALGDTNSNVLNKVMYQIAQNQLGTFDELKTFKDGPTKEGFKEFVDKHTMYQPDKYSAVREGENVVTKELKELTDDEKNEISRNKIEEQYNAIIERVCELMYNEVKDGSYTTDGINKLFSEDEYIRHLKKELYHPEGSYVNEGKQVFTAKPIGQTWKEFVNCIDAKSGYLHIMDANGDFTGIYYPQTADGADHGYIGRKILPDVYRELLIENYVREQRYTNLGRGYARKVEMIKIAHSEYDGKVLNMLNYYAKNHITGEGAEVTYGSLDWLNEAMTGIAIDSYGHAAKYLGESAGKFETIKIPVTGEEIMWRMHVDKNGETTDDPALLTKVYKGTKLGDIVEKFMKAFDIRKKRDDEVSDWGNFVPTRKFTEEAITAYNEFTNNDTYPVEVGVELKERELFSNDLTQDGWFMKNGGLTDITDEFRNRLFNINTSLIVDDSDKMKTDDKGWGAYESGDSARYFVSKDAQGNDAKYAYVVDAQAEADKDAYKSVVLHDDSNNFFIIKVSEAASLAKLSLEDERAYINLKATDKLTDSNKAMNEIIHGIIKPVASGDTYKKNAEQYYLMISNILFYDQSVYDYFKSQFPELFK